MELINYTLMMICCIISGMRSGNIYCIAGEVKSHQKGLDFFMFNQANPFFRITSAFIGIMFAFILTYPIVYLLPQNEETMIYLALVTFIFHYRKKEYIKLVNSRLKNVTPTLLNIFNAAVPSDYFRRHKAYPNTEPCLFVGYICLIGYGYLSGL